MATARLDASEVKERAASSSRLLTLRDQDSNLELYRFTALCRAEPSNVALCDNM